MTWWANIPGMASSLPSSALGALSSALQRKRPSTRYLVKASRTPERLLSILSERLEELVLDNSCLAHLRIVASNLLIAEIITCLQRLENHASYFRAEASTARRNTSLLWHRITRNQYLTALARAEIYEQQLAAIDGLIVVLHQFVGMHMQVVDDITAALEDNRIDQLARAIVSACRQAGAFVHGVLQSASDTELLAQIGDAVRSSLGASQRQNFSDNVNVAGQLGRFWNQNMDAAPSSNRLSAHDARVTLQIIQRELMDLRRMSRRLRSAAQRGLSEPWDVQRRPLRYGGLATATLSTARIAMVHSRLLGGTGELEDKLSVYSQVCTTFFTQNIVEPVGRFYHQVFHASPSSASEESVEVTRSAMREMLIEFTRNNLSHVEGAEDLARNGSMKAVMDLIREQARNPLRNSFAGSLGQAIVLQVQKLKCDVEELMLKTKQLLRAQELNLALVALVPSLLTASALMYMVSALSLQWRSRDTEMIVSTGQTAKFLLGDIHRNLLLAESEITADRRSMDFALRHVRAIGAIHVRTCELEELVEKGLTRAPEKVLLRFLRDVQLLRSSSFPFESKRRQVDRMFQCYAFLHRS